MYQPLKRFTTCLTLGLFLTACEQEYGLNNAVSEIRSIDPEDTNYTDLAPLKKSIGSSRIVLLGEQEHGDGATYLAKSRLVKFLHQEMGFNVLAFEADFFGVNKSWEDYKTGKKEYQDVLDQMYIFWSQSQMCHDLFRTVEKSQDTATPIVLAGFDNQHLTGVSREELIPALDSIMDQYDIRINEADLNFFFETLGGAMIVFHDQEIEPEDQDKFMIILQAILKELEAKQVDPFWVQELENIRGFVTHAWYWWIDRENDMVNNNHRDIQMAKNCLWLLNEKYKGEKMIVWAANGHIAKTDTLYEVEVDGWKPDMRQYPMGEVLFDSLGKEMYSIGFTSYSGSSTSLTYDSGTKDFLFEPQPFDAADSLSLEYQLRQLGHDYSFVDLTGQPDSWYQQEQRMRIWRPKYVRGKLPDIYDGIFFISEMHADTKLSNH